MEHISAILANCWWMILLSALIAYLLGSINTAVLVTGIVTKGKKDIRQMGSGNAGFTNVLRSVGKVPAIITIVCDALKCIIAVLIGGFIFSFASVAFQGESPIFINELINCGKYVAGIFCILGHSYPVYFHFKGGKGVVTAAALMLTEDWRVFTRYRSQFPAAVASSFPHSAGSIQLWLHRPCGTCLRPSKAHR